MMSGKHPCGGGVPGSRGGRCAGHGGGEHAADWTMGWRVGLPAGASWMDFLEGRDGHAAGAALGSFKAAAEAPRVFRLSALRRARAT